MCTEEKTDAAIKSCSNISTGNKNSARIGATAQIPKGTRRLTPDIGVSGFQAMLRLQHCPNTGREITTFPCFKARPVTSFVLATVV